MQQSFLTLFSKPRAARVDVSDYVAQGRERKMTKFWELVFYDEN